MQVLLAGKFVFLLVVANGAPVIAKKALGEYLARPIDGGLMLSDGRPLFGASKTIRGVVASVPFTMIAAQLIGVGAGPGAVIAVAAMTGDLASSFLKRRLGQPASKMAIGLDQIPESLLPALACQPILGLDLADVLWITLLFTVCELILSRLLFKVGIRDHPY